jgi:hypothetical protein
MGMVTGDLVLIDMGCVAAVMDVSPASAHVSTRYFKLANTNSHCRILIDSIQSRHKLPAEFEWRAGTME